MKRYLLLSSWVLIFCLWTLVPRFIIAQNLVPNPSFETYVWCPGGYGTGGSLSCTPWVNGNEATADFLHECATNPNVDIPSNFFGYQEAHTGNAYTGIYARESSIWREYLQVQLDQPLTGGLTYYVSFYTSLSDNNCGVTHLGAYLSATPPDDYTIGWLDADPQIEANIGYINNNEDWTLISGCFTAAGGEQWITIGNFYDNASSPLDPDCSAGFYSYYYIDDVSVTEGDPAEELDLELGDPVTTCDPYEIESGIDDVEYHWSDGSTDPTLTVTESGTYVLTVTLGCSQAIDSVEVTFLGAIEVEIGPAEVTICNSEPYTISLDPAAGDYEWQDGSTDPEYTITSSGTYSVTLDDGCDISSDQMTVTVIETPTPFSLGEDVPLCEGDEISYSFDEDLGNFLWQDNSNSPEYTISSPGTYSLTISNACGSTSDIIVITNGVEPAVDLGPDQSICEGEIFTINLNPNLGDYEWQDGSTSTTYNISSAGTYSVTVTNGCGSNNDQVAVTVMEPPSSFTLGEDVSLCNGDQVEFSFDPDLGDFEWQDHSTGSDYTVTSGGIYSLTISNECGQFSDAVEVFEIPLPDIELGNDQISICAGEGFEINLDESIGDFIWQDGNTSASYTITESGLYSVTVTNECGVSTDQVVAIAIDEPQFDFGENIVVCPAQLPITLDASNATNASAFLWQDNSTNPQLQVALPGIYAVTISNECFSIVDQIEIIVEDASPVVMLPPDQVVCSGDTFTIMTGGLVGDYLWQNGSTEQFLEVTQEGTYSLTVTNQCGTGSDSLIVTYTDTLPLLDLGPDFNLCPGEQFVLHANISGVNYVWQDLSMDDSLIIISPGQYILNVSNGCSSASDTITVLSNSTPPDVDLVQSIDLCSGDTILLDAGIAGVQYLWSDDSQSSAIQITQAGVYSITVTNTCGTDSDSIYVIDSGVVPVVSLGNDISICTGENIEISPVSSNIDSWLWQDGSTAPTYTITTSETVIVEATNQCGTAVDSMLVTVIPAITNFDLGNDTSLCSGESLLLEIQFPDIDIQWSDGSVNNNLEVSEPGTIYATISNICESVTDSIEIIFNEPVPDLNLGIDQSLCPGETIFISPDINDVEYLWHNGSTLSSFTVVEPGLIVLTISNECGISMDTMLISASTSGPEVDLGDDVTACEGEIVTLGAEVLGVHYLWQDGSTSSDLQVSNSGQYSVTVSNACGTGSDTVYVVFSGTIPSPQLGSDTIMCEDNSLWLLSSGNSEWDIMWQNGSSDASFEVTQSGTFILTEVNQCGTGSDTIYVTYQFPPAPFTLGPDTTLCPDDFIILNAPSIPGQFLWQDGSQDASMIADQEQTYWLEVRNQCGVSRDEIEITIDQNVLITDLATQIFWCPEETVTLDVSQDFNAGYSWNTGSTLPVIDANQPGIFSVLINSLCSSLEVQVEIVEDESCTSKFSLFVPNIFSPNRDGRNDFFTVNTSAAPNITSLHTHIFDRWGNEVFNSDQIEFSWDGSFLGKVLLPGVYTYLIVATFEEHGKTKTRKYSGDVTIL